MAEKFLIKIASDEDMSGVLGLYEELHPDIAPLEPIEATEIFRKLRSYDGSGIFIGSVGSLVVATCTLVVVPNLTRGGRPYALIENVVTAQAHRKQGLGGRVVSAAISAAWEHECYKVMLMTGSKDPSVLRFYTNLGFMSSKVGFEIRRAPYRTST